MKICASNTKIYGGTSKSLDDQRLVDDFSPNLVLTIQLWEGVLKGVTVHHLRSNPELSSIVMNGCFFEEAHIVSTYVTASGTCTHNLSLYMLDIFSVTWLYSTFTRVGSG